MELGKTPPNPFESNPRISNLVQLIKESTKRRINGRNRNRMNTQMNPKELNFSPKTKTNFTLNKDFFRPLLPWVPNSFIGNYFNKFEKLNDKHNITIWEKVIFIFFI